MKPGANWRAAAGVAVAGLCVTPALVLMSAGAMVAAPSPEWTAPIGSASSPPVIAEFDPPSKPWLAGHRGVDLAASVGAPVRAAGAGTITFAGKIAGRGVVTITHGELRTTYEPVDATVEYGQRVARGNVIGTVGTGSHCSVTCVHWGLLRGEEYLDPLLLLTWEPPVLKSLSRSIEPPTRRQGLRSQPPATTRTLTPQSPRPHPATAPGVDEVSASEEPAARPEARSIEPTRTQETSAPTSPGSLAAGAAVAGVLVGAGVLTWRARRK